MRTLVNRRRLLLLVLLALAAGLPLVLANPPQGKRYAVLVVLC
jgi:hypothetical protein